MNPNSTRKRRRRKSKIDRPPKPYEGFPLCAANNGYWQKKIRGTIHYIARWGQVVNGKMSRLQPDGCWQAALELYEQQRDALHAGRTLRIIGGDGFTIADLCNHFLTAKLRLVESSEISPRTFSEYRNTTNRLVAAFGKRRLVDDLAASDFAQLRADADLVFITKYGHRWVRTGGDNYAPIDAVGSRFDKLLCELKIKRPGLGFYGLRHSHRTVADAAKDILAARLIMGYADQSIDAVYRERIDDSRLEAVANHVHEWLFGEGRGGQ